MHIKLLISYAEIRAHDLSVSGSKQPINQGYLLFPILQYSDDLMRTSVFRVPQFLSQRVKLG